MSVCPGRTGVWEVAQRAPSQERTLKTAGGENDWGVHGITEWDRSEKTSGITQPGLCPNTAVSAGPGHGVPRPAFPQTPPRTATPSPPWAAHSSIHHPFCGEILPNVQPKPPLAQIKIVSSKPVANLTFPLSSERTATAEVTLKTKNPNNTK